MFDISWGELVLIGMVALIVIGPKELPTVLRTVGQYMAKIRRMASEFQGQFQEAMREAEFADLKKEVDQMGESARGMTEFNPLDTVRKEFESTFGDKPAEPAVSSEPPRAETSVEAAAAAPDPAPSADAPPAAPAEAATPDPSAPSTPGEPSPTNGGRAA